MSKYQYQSIEQIGNDLRRELNKRCFLIEPFSQKRTTLLGRHFDFTDLVCLLGVALAPVAAHILHAALGDRIGPRTEFKSRDEAAIHLAGEIDAKMKTDQRDRLVSWLRVARKLTPAMVPLLRDDLVKAAIDRALASAHTMKEPAGAAT